MDFNKKLSRKITVLFLLISFFGLLDSAYLTAEHFQKRPLFNCSVLEGCQKVTTGPYSTIGGVPVALLGVVYYLTVFCLGLIGLRTAASSIVALTAPLTAAGFLFSVYLIYLQIFVIKALCLYCLFSAAAATALFLLALFLLAAVRNDPLRV